MTDRNQMQTMDLLRLRHAAESGISLDALTEQRDNLDELIQRLKTVPPYPTRPLKFSIAYTYTNNFVSISQTTPTQYFEEPVLINIYVFPVNYESGENLVRTVCIPDKESVPCPSDHDALNWTAFWFQWAERTFMGRNGYVKDAIYGNLMYLEDGETAHVIPDNTTESTN